MLMKRFFLLLVLIFVPFSVFAIQVAEDEVRQKIPSNIHFVNYTGERQHTDEVRDILAIGQDLSRQIKKGRARAGFGLLKYTLIHAVDLTQTNGLDADILQIDPLARVDHIFAVRMILSGYLSDQYGYGLSASKALATFITYYNAYYRKNTNYFESRFKKKVIQNLDPEKAGLATHYQDWPGHSQIVIPLTEGKAQASELANDSVLSNMRKAKNKNIDVRKEVNNLRKKEVEQKKQALNETNNQLLQKEQTLRKQEKEIDEQQKQLIEESNKVAAMPESPEKEQKQATIQKKQQSIKQEKKEVEKAKSDIQVQKEQVQDQKKQIKKEENKVETEEKNIRSDEADVKIEKDTKAFQEELKKKDADLAEKEKKLGKVEQELKEGKTDKRIAAGKLYYLKTKSYMTGGHYNNEMYLIDVVTHKIIKKAAFTNICGKDYHVFKDGVVVIGHGGGKDHSSGHFLVFLDGTTLEVRAKGNADVFWRSFVEIRDDFFYAIILKSGLFYLGKFDGDLQLVAVSERPVFKDTFISFFGDVLYVSSQNKGILVLKQSDLSLVDEVKPE